MVTKKRPAPRKVAPARKPRAPVKKAGTSKEAAAHRKHLFAEAYIANGGNATDAAKAAGYSAHSAAQQASRLLRDANVSHLIAQRSKDLARRYELTTDMVVRSIVQELTFDPADLYDQLGRLKPVRDLAPDVRMALTSFEEEQVGGDGAARVTVRKVKWAQRQGAREQAMKHLGMFSADNKQRSPLEGMPHEVLVLVREALKKHLAQQP